MKTRGRFIHVWGTPPNSIGFHCAVVFITVLRHRSWGVPLGELKKIIFFNTIFQKKWSFRGTVFFWNVPVQELQTYRVVTPQRELHIYPYTCNRVNSLQNYIHKIWTYSSFFWGMPPNSIGFQCKVGVFHCSAWKLMFLNTKQKEIDHFGWPVVL